MANMLNFVEKVPPLEHLLANGVPSVAALDTYIADLDLDLEENSKDLDLCLQDMLKMTNTIVGKEYITPRDALLTMISTHVLEKDTCYDPEPDAVTEILAHAAYMLDQVPGSEEAVFQDLLSLSSEQGLSLPLRTTAVDPIASTMSLNAVSDNSEAQIAQHWDQIALRLRRYFQDRLSSLPVTPSAPEIDLYERRRLKYLQSLMTLQPVEEVWEKYQVIRRQQLERCLSVLMPENESEGVDILNISENCADVAKVIMQMMNEDFTVLNDAVMKKSSSIFHAFHKTYLDKFSDEMSALIDEVWDEIRDSLKRGPSQSFSTQGSRRKVNPARPGTGTMQQAHSLDCVVGIQENTESQNQHPTIPVKYMKVMLNIVTTLQRIEEHMDCLQRAAIWDVGGIAVKKSQRKGSLKGVLKPTLSPDLSQRPSSATMSSVDSEAWMSDGMASSYSSVSSSMMFEPPPGPKVTVVEKMKLEEKVKWDWKFIFKKIAPELAHSVQCGIQNTMATSLGEEHKQWASTHTVTTVTLDPTQWGGRLDYPKIVSKAVYDFMQELETYLVMAKSGNNGVLNSVRSAFVDCANTCLKNVHTHLTKMSSDVPLQSPVKSLYVILSSAAYIRNHLLHFDTVLAQDDGKKPFSLQYKQFVELVESLTDQVILNHNNYIASSILHDTDSHNWTETKEFFEGERCTFPVQMWHYYLRGIQFDMWSICPPKLAQTSFSVILHDSLQILTQRYTQAKPSFRRIATFCSDIKTVLLSVSELLYSCSNSISKCIDAGHSQIPHYSIHNLCTALLSAMVVVGSPLETLNKVNKKGYRYRQKRKSFTNADRGGNCNWLNWIHRTLIEKGVKSYEEMRTTTALYLHTRLLLCQPELSYPLTLQAYFMKDYTLSILFLTQTVTLYMKADDGEPQGELLSPKSIKYIHSDPQVTEEAVREFTMSLFRVVTHSTEFSDGLAKVVIPVIDRCDDWACLDIRHVPGRDMQVPVWMEGIFACMKPFVQRVLKPVIEYVTSQSEARQITPVSAVKEELPCGCRTQASTTVMPRSTRKSEDRDVDAVLRLVLNQIAEDMFVLPVGVCVMFKALEAECKTKGMKTPHHCVGTKLIALALQRYLLNTAQLSEHLGLNLSESIDEELKLLSDCIYHVLVSGKIKGSSTPRLAGKFCRDNKDWINDKLQVFVYYLNSELLRTVKFWDEFRIIGKKVAIISRIFDMSENSLSKDGSTEFVDQMYMSVTSDILSTTHGLSDVQKLHWLLHNNSEWLHNQLDIRHILPLVEHSPDHDTFTLDMTPKPLTQFNPLQEFQCIGPYKLDHAAIENMPVDWEKLLQSDLGLSELGFRTLLYNRHEMQDGAFLEEKEKKPVANLKALFENDPRELR